MQDKFRQDDEDGFYTLMANITYTAAVLEQILDPALQQIV